MRADFNVSLDALGALLGPFAIGCMLGSFVSGRVLVRWKLGIVLAASAAAMAVNLLGSASSPAWWLLLALLGDLAQSFELEVIVPTLLATAFVQMACYLAWSRSHRS